MAPTSLMTTKIYLAADHAGYIHKEAVRLWLVSEGLDVVDVGAHAFSAEDDFPDYMSKAAEAVSKASQNTKAILFGGSGQGEAMVANRYPNVRAVVYYGSVPDIITLSREHNDANVLSIGARFVSVDETKRAIWDWLTYDVVRNEKYTRRNQKIEAITRTLQL